MNRQKPLPLGELPEKPEYMRQKWAKDNVVDEFFPDPYRSRESFNWFRKRIFGPSKKYRHLTDFIPKKIRVNQIDPEFEIGFVGDIMPVFQHDLEFGKSIIKFFKGVDLMVGNLEGIITVQPKYIMAQRHNLEIMDQLETIADAENWLLGLSNNHSGDFGFADYIFMINKLHWRGFNLMGRKDIPSFLFEDKLNFVSGTEWSNQRGCNYVSSLFDRDKYYDDTKGVMNILFPHWNFEMEAYPRPRMKKRAERMIDPNKNYIIDKNNNNENNNNHRGLCWDFIVGHHTHIPQPITTYQTENVNKVIAYSLGDFSSALDQKMHNFGLIIRCKVGPLVDSRDTYAVGDLQWEFVHSEDYAGWRRPKFKDGMEKPDNPPLIKVEVVEKCKYFRKEKNI